MMKLYSYKMLFLTLAFLCFLLQSTTINAQVNLHKTLQQSKVYINLPTDQLGRQDIKNIDTSLGSRILEAMNATYVKTLPYNQHGISASVSVPGLPQWSGVVGDSYPGVSMDTTLICEVGSITKTFVAALIMKLQDDGKLSIKDSIYKWLTKHYPNVDSAITIEMLLNHSSGIFDYVNDDTDATVLTEQYFGDPSKKWTAEEILLNHVFAPNFKPGKDFKYSNTNYILLGLIAERVAGASLRDQIHSRFIDPLHLSQTFVGGIDSVTIPFAHNWSPAHIQYPITDLYKIDKTAQLTGSPGDGNICSTPSDMIRWAKALYLGDLVSKNALKQMESLNHWKDGFYYGLGTEFSPYYSHGFYGHTGSMVGFKSAMFANPKDSVCVSLFVNWDPDATENDIYMNDYLIAILNEIYKPASSVGKGIEYKTPSVSVYPNPATTSATIVTNLNGNEDAMIRLYNEFGMEVLATKNLQMHQGMNSITLDVSKLSKGVYFYNVQTNTVSFRGKLFIK